MTSKKLLEFAQSHYDYETSHVDAADAYSIIFNANLPKGRSPYDMDFSYHCEFRTQNHDGPDVLDSIFLGQEEMEIQLPRPIRTRAEETLLDDNGFACQLNSDLVYTMYPENLYICAIAD